MTMGYAAAFPIILTDANLRAGRGRRDGAPGKRRGSPGGMGPLPAMDFDRFLLPQCRRFRAANSRCASGNISPHSTIADALAPVFLKLLRS